MRTAEDSTMRSRAARLSGEIAIVALLLLTSFAPTDLWNRTAVAAVLDAARAAFAEGRYADAARDYRRLLRANPNDPALHMSLACSLALSKRKSDAMTQLKRAVQLGYRDFDWMQQDPDLEALKNHPEFQELLKQLKPQS